MDQFAILYLLALFCIALAPTQASYRRIHKIRAAKLEIYGRGASSKVFDGEDVHLYKRELPEDEWRQYKWFAIGDASNWDADGQFPISLSETVFTKGRIIISMPSRTTTIILDGNDDTFALYRRILYPLGDYSSNFRVAEIFQDDKELTDVTVIKAENYEQSVWIFAALDADGEPHLVFTDIKIRGRVNVISATEVSFKLETVPEMDIIVAFENPTEANKFRSIV